MKVICNICSAHETKKVSGYIVRECDNRGIFEVRLDHNVSFKGSRFSYSAGDTMLVSKKEIEKS
jgi:hypothetical protein